MNPFSIVSTILKFSLAVGLAGGLADMTRSMMNKSAKAHEIGLVKLGDLNKVLFKI